MTQPTAPCPTTIDSDSSQTPYFTRREHLGRPWAKHWLRFEHEMLSLGLTVHECGGPNGWGGPAVTVPAEEVARVLRGTRLKLDSHNEGGSVVLYPAAV